jgi:adenylate kinase
MLVLLGPPGAGKGTQAVGLARELGLAHVSTGDLFRAHLRAATSLGLAAEATMARGELVPDEVVIGMVRDRLAAPDAAAGAVLDGFPRTAAQAAALDALLAEAGGQALYALELDVPDEVIVDRLGGRRVCRDAGHTFHVRYRPPHVPGVCDMDGSALYQRPDDSPETVGHRLAVYHREVAPVLDYYRAAGRLGQVDGQGEPAEIAARLRAALAVLAT